MSVSLPIVCLDPVVYIHRIFYQNCEFRGYSVVFKEGKYDNKDMFKKGVDLKDNISSVIIGPRTIDQLKSSQRALEIEFTCETLDLLDEIFPGPGGKAPQAYAW